MRIQAVFTVGFGLLGLAPTALAVVDGTTEVDAHEEWEDEGEVEYCGGEESSVVDEAWHMNHAGDHELARRLLADALKHGQVRAWQRPQALSMLAEIQLRMGDDRPAAYNYGRALALEPELAHTAVRLGHATALYRLGRDEEALALSRSHIRESCATGQSTVDCYGAYVIVSQLTTEATEMFESLRSAESIRIAQPAIDEDHGWLIASLDER